MNNYTFYLPGIDKLIGISQEDWQFLEERAQENGILPATLAARIISNEIAMWRDQIHYADEQEALAANRGMNVEKLIEEVL